MLNPVELIFIRHGKSVPNGTPVLAHQISEWHVDLLPEGVELTRETGKELGKLFPEDKFLLVASPLPRTVQSAAAGKEGIGPERVYGPVTNRALIEINLGTEYHPSRHVGKIVYGSKSGHTKFWPSFNCTKKIHSLTLDHRPTDGESIGDVKLRAEAFVSILKEFVRTRDYTLLGISKEAAAVLTDLRIKPVFYSHSIFLSCVMSELGLTELKKPADRFKVKNSEAVIVNIDETGHAAFAERQLTDVVTRNRVGGRG